MNFKVIIQIELALFSIVDLLLLIMNEEFKYHKSLINDIPI